MLEMGLKYCKPQTFHSHKIIDCNLAFSHLKWTKLFLQRAALVFIGTSSGAQKKIYNTKAEFEEKKYLKSEIGKM
jgi:hypothetical protein